MRGSSPTVLPAEAASAEALCDAFNASFADYLLPFPVMDVAGWHMFVARQGCDLSKSFVACRGDVVTAFALVTPRPWHRARIAVMGARPDERGSGVAARLLDDAIAAASARGDKWIELEAFAQNERAVRLYRSRGFEPVDALCGYTAAPAQGAGSDEALIEISREEAARRASAFDQEDPAYLPWQTSGDAMLRVPGQLRAWRLGRAQLAFQDAEPLVALSLIDGDPAQGDALCLLRALRHRFPSRALRAPQLHRADGPARAFDQAGWLRHPLHQLLMRRPLRG